MTAISRLVASVGAALLIAGCATPDHGLRHDPPEVERLRLQVTKVRNAIRETREAISQSRGAPILDELYVRLAELLSEEAEVHYHIAWEREQRSSRVLHVPQVRFLKEQSIGTYQRTLDLYPDSELADRVLFNIGHELRELGRYEEMVKTLARLVSEHPDSALRSEALLVLGDYHFDRFELDEAETWYRKLTEGDVSHVTGLGWYKLGWVWVNRAECEPALQAFDQAITVSDTWEAVRAEAAAAGEAVDEPAPQKRKVTTSRQDIDVRREALVDLTYCYAREREPHVAVDYLRGKAYDRHTFVAALERLSDRYAVLDSAEGALRVSRELLRLGPSHPSRLDDARLLYQATRRLETYDRVGEDVTLVTEAMLRQIRRVQTTDEGRKLLVEEFEIIARDLATRAQEVLEKRRKAGEQLEELAAEVARGYRSYLAAFPDSKHRADILQNQAEVLGDMKAYEDSGRRYLEAARLVEDDVKRNDMLYEAVVQLERSLVRLTERTRVERVVVRASLRTAGRDVLKAGLPPERARKVKLAIARTYYDEGRYRDAIDRLNAVAWESPGTPEAKAAIHLVLDSYNTLNDYDGLIAAGHGFLGASSPADEALKAQLRPIVDQAEQRRLDEVSLAAAGAEGGELVRLEKLAERYQGTRLGERALLNAFVASRAVGDSERLYKLGERITTHYPESEQLPGVLASLARNAVATFDFDRALTLFERAAKANPDQQVRLYTASGDLLDQLGDAEGALNMFRRAHAVAGDGPGGVEPATRMAQLLERLGDDPMTVAILKPLAGSGNPEVLARLGMAQVRLGQIEQGEGTLARVIDGTASASAEATARAQYGMAEALYHVLRTYAPGGDLDAIQEFVTLVEVTEQSYLTAARQGSPVFTPAALIRLANMSLAAAKRMRSLAPPTGLSMDDVEAFQKGLERRTQELEKQAKDAMAACVEQAWAHKIFNAPVRACLQGDVYARDPLGVERLKPRVQRKPPGRVDGLRGRLAKNPEDLEALREIGTLFQGLGEHHIARLVFARAVQVGGGPDELNQLGLSSYAIGDLSGAMDAFSRAADGDLEAGRQNLATILRELGLGDAAKAALGRWPQGKPGGQLLRGGGR